jgi:hypothetical protein
MKRTLPIAWGLLRLPLLGLGLYLFRFRIAAWIESAFELWRVMDVAVYLASTFSTRLFVYAAFVLALGFWVGLAGKPGIPSGMRHTLAMAAAFAGIYSSFAYFFKTTEPLARAAAVTALLAANTVPHGWLAKRAASGGIMNLVCLAGIGWMEALFPQAYFLWLMDQFRAGDSIKKWSWLAGVAVAPLLWVFVLVPFDNQRMLTLGEKLHASPAVEKFAQGDFNWLELNAEHGLLYAVGRGTNHLLAFDVNRLEQPPRRSREDIGKTQSFAFNPLRGELYVYKAETAELVYLDALTLETLRSTPAPDLSPGDVWVNWQSGADTITIASEADLETGTPFFVIDRESGAILATLPLPWVPTNVAFHPEKPILYFNSFKDTYLAAWDMREHRIIAQTETSPRTDRLVYSPAASEVLVASPLEGAILRYDTGTLEFKGRLQSRLGDRTLTIDPQRNLLLVGNFVNNQMQVMDLDTFKVVNRFYIGPWIRTIALDMERGIAYVSTARNLFRVEYAASKK